MTTYKKGNLRADKVKHDDGTSGCWWYRSPVSNTQSVE